MNVFLKGAENNWETALWSHQARKKCLFSAALIVAQIPNQLQLKNEIIKRKFKSKLITVIKSEKYGFLAYWWMETLFSASTDHYIFVLLSAIDAKNVIFALDVTTVMGFRHEKLVTGPFHSFDHS